MQCSNRELNIGTVATVGKKEGLVNTNRFMLGHTADRYLLCTLQAQSIYLHGHFTLSCSPPDTILYFNIDIQMSATALVPQRASIRYLFAIRLLSVLPTNTTASLFLLCVFRSGTSKCLMTSIVIICFTVQTASGVHRAFLPMAPAFIPRSKVAGT